MTLTSSGEYNTRILPFMNETTIPYLTYLTVDCLFMPKSNIPAPYERNVT